MDGVVGSDDVDGDITDRIEIDKGDYDPGVAGKYTITYNLTDSAGNAAVPKQRIIKGDGRYGKAPDLERRH